MELPSGYYKLSKAARFSTDADTVSAWGRAEVYKKNPKSF